MFLVKLDQNNVAESLRPLTETAMLPLNITLAEYVIVAVPVTPGQTFDPETGQFSGPTRRRWLTKLAFDNRFTMAEATNLKLAQVYPARLPEELDADYMVRCTIPATLQVMQGRMNLASYIDLDRVDTRNGVQQLEALGLLATGRALEILDGEIAESEYHPTA